MFFKVLEFIPKVLAWLQIAASPIIIGLIAGALIYVYNRNAYGLTIGITVALLGVIIGALWAARVWKRRGTVEHMARLIHMSELHPEEKEPPK
jgi:hypothetical protein